MNATPSIYNPRDVSPEQLDELLTGRAALLGGDLADVVVRNLETVEPASAPGGGASRG